MDTTLDRTAAFLGTRSSSDRLRKGMLSADGAVLVADGLFEKDLTLLGLFALVFVLVIPLD